MTMRCIWKFKFNLDIEMPVDAKIIRVGRDQQGDVCMWAIFDFANSQKKTTRKFSYSFTGLMIGNDSLVYIDSFSGDGEMWHLFEMTGGKV